MQVRDVPDPSVALGSPFWRVEGARGALLGHLMRQGRSREVTALRHVLGRTEMDDALAPYRLLRGWQEDEMGLEALARWIAEHVRIQPTQHDWIQFIEGRCRLIRHGAGNTGSR
jgi:hypothetical protein